MSHGSARLTVHGRRLIVQRHQAGWKQAHIAAAMGVSRKCVKTWIDRLRRRRRSRSDHPFVAAPHDAHEDQRGGRAEGPGGPRASTVTAPTCSARRSGCPRGRCHGSCAATHVPYLRECDPMTGAVIRSSKQTAVRYERERPGELVHMDVKKIGRIPDGGGWRVHGRGESPRDRRPRSATTTSTPWSMTTPGWPTPRSCPTRRAPPARRSSSAPSPTSPPTASPGSSG